TRRVYCAEHPTGVIRSVLASTRHPGSVPALRIEHPDRAVVSALPVLDRLLARVAPFNESAVHLPARIRRRRSGPRWTARHGAIHLARPSSNAPWRVRELKIHREPPLDRLALVTRHVDGSE